MEQAQQPDVAERVADLAEPYARALLTIREYAVGLLDAGYTREALCEDFERARSVLKERDAPEESEEAILEVMDFLVGFSSGFMKL